jgi:hypothetical protein
MSVLPGRLPAGAWTSEARGRMKTALTYYTVEGEKRLTPLGEAICLIGALLAWLGAGVFLGSGFAFGLPIGFAIGIFYQERATRKREYRERLKREHDERWQRDIGNI